MNPQTTQAVKDYRLNPVRSALHLTCAYAFSAALLWSGDATAAPGRPLLSPVSSQYDLAFTGKPAAVQVGWYRLHGEQATSAQYRLDGRPVLSRAVEPGEPQSGNATVRIGTSGQYALTVALCNVDGCSESDSVALEVHDGSSLVLSAHSTPLTEAEVEAWLHQITASTAILADRYGQFNGLSIKTPAGSASLATSFGKAALGGITKAGGIFVFEMVMQQLGLPKDAYGQVKDALEELNGKVEQLTRNIQDLHDVTVWQGFLNQHKDANNAANLIYANFGYVTEWIIRDLAVPAEDWRAARDNIANALTLLAGAQSNPVGGIVDSQDGAIDQLLRAIPQRVATMQSYWPLVDEYRDYYRAAIATGFLGLDLVADHFDGSGVTRVKADHALEVGRPRLRQLRRENWPFGWSDARRISGLIAKRSKRVWWHA